MRIASIRTLAAVGFILASGAAARDARAVPLDFTTSTSGANTDVSATTSVYWSLTISTPSNISGAMLDIHDNGNGNFTLRTELLDSTGTALTYADAIYPGNPGSPASGFNVITFTFPTAVSLTDGSYYIELVASPTFADPSGSYQVKRDGSYNGGSATASNTPPQFQATVPEPASVLVLGAALVGLTLVRAARASNRSLLPL